MHKKILSHINEAILVFDQQFVLIFINTTGEVLFADSSNHLLGKKADHLFKSSDSAILMDLKYCMAMNEPIVERELNLVHMKQTFTVNFSATPVYELGAVREIIVELQHVDRQMKINKEEQFHAQQNLSRMLVKGLAHEIKNPLGSIRGAAQLLDFELNDKDLKEYTQIIIQESDRLKGLLDRMLGPNKPAKKDIMNIHEVLERVRQLVMVEPNNDIEIITDYDPSIPNLHADKNQLIQAVLNIVQNAVQAMHYKGKITLKTRIIRHTNVGRKLYKLIAKVDIIDNGPGINEELKNQIFYPMITGRAEGTGLGLSIAQSLISQHNGIIECESKPGYTNFSIHLPLEQSHEYA